MSITRRQTTAFCRIDPGPTAQGSEVVPPWIKRHHWINCHCTTCYIRDWIVDIFAPFPDQSMHVVQPPRIDYCSECNRSQCFTGIVINPGNLEQLFAPITIPIIDFNQIIGQTSTTGKFPLGLSREACFESRPLWSTIQGRLCYPSGNRAVTALGHLYRAAAFNSRRGK